MTNLTKKEISKAVREVFDNVISSSEKELVDKLLSDIQYFSGFKSYRELKEVTNLLVDKNGALKSFDTFQKDVIYLNNNYNLNYLKAEYNHAVASSQMAKKWQIFDETKDLFDLQYVAVKDDRTRADHSKLNGIVEPVDSAFWDTFYPPNGWNCRCTVKRVKKGTSGKEVSSEEMNKVKNDMPSMFWANTAKKGVVFPEKHPYFNVSDEEKSKINEILNK